MKPLNNIDDLFRDKLSQTEIPMSGVEDLWAQIDPHKPKKKKRFFFWIFAGLMGAAMTGWIVWQSDFMGAEPPSSQITSETEHPLTTAAPDPTPMAQKAQTNQNPSTATSEMSQPPASTQPNITYPLTVAAPSSPATTDALMTQKNKEEIEKKSKSLVAATTTVQRSPSISAQDDAVLTNDFRKKATQTQTQKPATPIAVETPAPNPVQHKSVLSSKGPELLRALIGLAGVDRSELSYTRRVPAAPPAFATRISPVEPADPKPTWHVATSITMALPTERIQSPIGQQDTLLEESWDQSVDPLSSYQWAVTIGKMLNEKNRLSLGLEYQHLESQHRLITDRDTTVSVWNPEAYVSETNGIIGDSMEIVITQRTTILRPLRETRINLPLRYHRHITEIGSLDLGVELGLILNLSRRVSGPLLQADNRWVETEGSSQTRIGISYDLAVPLSYALTERQTLFLAPRVRYSQGVQQDGLPFTLSRLSGGLELGYGIAF